MTELRKEILTFPRPDGGVDLYDPLLERLHSLAADTSPPPELFEGPLADALRRSFYLSRVLAPRAPEVLDEGPAVDPAAPGALPRWVAPEWRRPEPWRRLAEERRAGRTVLILRGFLDEAFAQDLAAEVRSLAWGRFETDRMRVWRAPVGAGPAVSAWTAAAGSVPLRRLAGAALGRALPSKVVANAWRLDAGDHMGVHPDGRSYAATWTLGLNLGWTAADGGAIAFGEPEEGGLAVSDRVLPFLGDLGLFAPHATSWHAVEPPRRTRYTLSGWWVEPS